MSRTFFFPYSLFFPVSLASSTLIPIDKSIVELTQRRMCASHPSLFHLSSGYYYI